MIMKLYPQKNSYLLISVHCLLFVTLFILLPVINWVTNFHQKEYFIAIVGIWGVFNFIQHNKKTNPLTNIDIWVFIFIIYQILHFKFLGNSSFFEILFWWRLSFIVLYLIFKDLLLEYQNLFKKALVILIVLRCTLELIIGFLQYLNVIDISISEYFSVAGTFTSTNHYALCLGVGIVTILLQPKIYKNNKIVYAIAGLITIGSLFLIFHTKSRSAFLSLIVVGIIYFLFKKGFIKKIKALSKSIKFVGSIFIIVIMVVSGYFIYTIKKDSADGRVFCAKITLIEIIKNPFVGNGLFSFEEGYNTAKSAYFTEKKRDWSEIKIADHVDHAMNDYLELIYEIGLIGLFLLVVLLIQISKKIMLNTEASYTGFLILIFYMICGLFTTMVTNSFFMLLILISLFLLMDKDYVKGNTSENIFNRYKLFTLCASLLLFMIGILKIYAFHWEKAQLEKGANTAKSSDWKFWTNVLANNGNYEFVYGIVLHDTYQRKKEAMAIMEKGVMKNKKTENIRNLALYYGHNGNLKKAEDLLKFNIGNEPFLFKPRLDLAVIYQKTNQKKKYIYMLKEIIELPVKIPSEKVTEIKNEAKKRLFELAMH